MKTKNILIGIFLGIVLCGIGGTPIGYGIGYLMQFREGLTNYQRDFAEVNIFITTICCGGLSLPIGALLGGILGSKIQRPPS